MARAAKTDNYVDPKIKKTFLECRDEWQKLNDRANSAAAKRRQYEGEIKEHGFSKQQIKISLMLQTPEGEAEFKAEMANRLLAAAYSDAAIGDQLSMFLDHDRTPAIDRAAKEGQTAAMKNEAHAPPYDSSVPQFKAWSDAFYAEQERQVKAGIGKLDAKAAKANAKGKKAADKPKGKRGRPAKAKGPNADPPAGSERTLIPKAEKDAKAAARAAKPSAPPRKPTVAPVTRASIAASKAAVREEADSYFSKSAETKGNA